MQPQFFAELVPKSTWERWLSGSGKQVIGQAETLPVLAARLTWKEALRGKSGIFFIDNDSARFALIKRTSPSKAATELSWEVAAVDMAIRLCPWYERVASAANPADLP
eukprot:4183750-Alexandrium_andersonii.AAC.1